MNETLLVRGRWIVTGEAGSDAVIHNGAVAVQGGRIQELGGWRPLRDRYPDASVIGSEGMAVLPGLVNAHHHSNGVTAIQHGIDDALLEPWILNLGRQRPSDRYLNTLVSATRLLRTGVTTVVDVASGGGSPENYMESMCRALRAYDEAGLRAALAPGISNQSYLVHGGGEDARFIATLTDDGRQAAQRLLPGPGDVDEDAYIEIMRTLIEQYRAHPRIDIWFGPPGPQWVSDPFLQRIADEAQAFDTGIQTHVNESFYEKLHGSRCYGQSTVEHLRDLGVLSPRFSMAHGVWLTADEIGILAETGAAVSHNPGSNLRLRAGIAPLNDLLAAGVTVGLGMDGTSLNEDEDMFTEMRLALRLHRTPFIGSPAPTAPQVLGMATTAGARLMRKESQLGRLAPGYQADMALVALDRITWPWVAPEADPRELVLLRAAAGDVHTVLIGGEVVLRGGLPTRFDAAAAARELAESLSAQPYPQASADDVAALLPHLEAWYATWKMPKLEPYAPCNSRR